LSRFSHSSLASRGPARTCFDGKRMKFSFFSVYSRSVGVEKKKRTREGHSFCSLSLVLSSAPTPPSPAFPSLTVSRGSFWTVERVPESQESAIASLLWGEVQSCFYRSSSEQECCSLFSFARREIPRRKKEQLERERPVFELSFSSRYARSRVLRSPLSLWRLAERERAKGGRRERERERAVEGQRRCRRRRRHEGDGDCSSVSSVRSPAFGCSSLFTQQCVHTPISTNTAER